MSAWPLSTPGLDERHRRMPLTIPGLPGNDAVEIVGTGVLSDQAQAETVEPPPRHGKHTVMLVEL